MSALVHWAGDVPPQPPYYAVIFSTQARDPRPGYAEMDAATMKAAAEMSGYLGHQVTRHGDRTIFISYWRDMDGIDAWRKHGLHLAAKRRGRADWYDAYSIEICRVEHAAAFER